MALDYIGLAELLKINDQNNADRDISDLLDKAPFLRSLAADVASQDTIHTYLKQTGAPVVGFRAVNAGRENDHSEDTLVTVTLKILDASFAIDKALADGYFRGAASFVSREANRHLKQAFAVAEKQFLNGTVGGESDGFTGLANALLLANAMTVGAGGTTASTASSVYLVRSTGDLDNVVAITGRDGLIDIGETVTQRIAEAGDPEKHLAAYYTPIHNWFGMQIGGARSVGRIANLTDDSGKGLTDALIAEAISKFPSNEGPTSLVMNRRSLYQLQTSRTATNGTGAPAPFPSESHGVPIITTDGILSTEELIV